MLNRLWLIFFLLSFFACLIQALFLNNAGVFNDVTQSMFAMAETSVNIALGLIGIMCLWLGIFRIAEESRLIDILSKGLAPFFARVMPEVPRDHPAQSAVTMNLAANMLGLDNAATPLGIKAMQSLQSLNPNPHTATNAQILFLVLNTSSVTLLPVTIFMYRAQAGAASPTDVFLPILIATACSSLAGLLAVSWFQKIRLYQPVVLAYLMGFAFIMACMLFGIASLSSMELSYYSGLTANIILFTFVTFVLAYAAYRKKAVYDLFVDGAKEGFNTAIQLIPYLVAMLIAIAVLRASGVLDGFIAGIAWIFQAIGMPTEFTDALPTGFMKPFSGSGSRAMMLESFEAFGVDSLIGRMTAIMQGSTETTFYVLAVYFGAVGIRYGRHAVVCGLIADFAGIFAAILSTYYFFG